MTAATARRRGRPRVVEDDRERRRHISVAYDVIVGGLSADETADRRGLCRRSVYYYIDRALSYPCEAAQFLREVLEARAQVA